MTRLTRIPAVPPLNPIYNVGAILQPFYPGINPYMMEKCVTVSDTTWTKT